MEWLFARLSMQVLKGLGGKPVWSDLLRYSDPIDKDYDDGLATLDDMVKMFGGVKVVKNKDRKARKQNGGATTNSRPVKPPPARDARSLPSVAPKTVGPRVPIKKPIDRPRPNTRPRRSNI